MYIECTPKFSGSTEKKIELAYVNTFKFINKLELKSQLSLMCDAYL